jgi:N-acyl-D-amino-acid deacylase
MIFDVLITGGTIVDGSGHPGFPGDVGISGDRIAALGDLSGAQAATVIDAAGLVVAPGFIDPHNHAHNEARTGITSIPGAENYIRQGVTTLVAGNCGGSAWPIGEHLDAVAACRFHQNYATLVGMGTMRARAVTEGGRPANLAEVSQLQGMLRQSLDEGAVGMSTGYFGAFVTVDEIAAVSKPLGERGAIYTSHIRSEGDNLLGSVEEIIEIGIRAEAPVQISHIKTYGQRNWWKADQVLQLMEQGQRRGVDVMADRYPYIACFTGIAALMPLWARSETQARGGWDSLSETAWNARARRAVADQFDLIGGSHNVMLAPLDPKPELDGKRLDDYAAEVGRDPIDVALDLIQRGGISCIYFVMCEDNIDRFYRHPLVTGGSDGHLRVLGEGVSHPRNYGTFPRIIGRYARDRGTMSLEAAVRKCSAITAERFGLKDRGLLRRGAYADIVVFDWNTIADRATFEDQHRYPVGIPWVLVNGKIAVAEGEATDALPGRVLRRGEG